MAKTPKRKRLMMRQGPFSILARVVIVASRFNESITNALIDGARATFEQAGIASSQIRVIQVPGAFELPVVTAWVARRLRPDAIVALGCILKGETPQYTAIGHAVAEGLTQISVASQIPVTFGVIIADSPAQAKARAGGSHGNRGQEAALAALELLELSRQIDQVVVPLHAAGMPEPPRAASKSPSDPARVLQVPHPAW